MSPLDALKDPIARAIDRTVQTLGEHLAGQLEDGRRRLNEAAETLKSELPKALLAEDAVAHLASAPDAAPSGSLLDAVARIDAAGSQGAVLSALLEGAESLADRCAFFVAHETGLRGWASTGFAAGDDAVGGRHIAFSGPWEHLARSTGAARLVGDGAAAFADAMGVEPASESLFVPLFLRARLGGFLYADRCNGDGSIDTAALRLLTHISALSLETLPVRGGASSTLALDDGSATSPLPVFLTTSPAAAAAREPVEDEIPQPDGGAPSGEAGDDTISTVQDAVAEEPPAFRLGEAARLEDAVVEAAAIVEEVAKTSVKPEQDAATEELFGEDTITEQIHVDASFPKISHDDPGHADAPSHDTDTLELEPIDPSLIERPADTDSLSADPIGFATEVDERFAHESSQQTVRVNMNDAVAQGPVDVAPPPAPALDDAASEDATVMAQRSSVYRAPASEPSPEPAPRKTTEVQPPTDLSGPGSAFSAGNSAGDLALREEARRLARLLVSEIKLYNEDPLEEGRREGNIYNRLKDDIDRSRKMYHERIDPRLEDADDFFYQELVDRLAGGNADLLGM